MKEENNFLEEEKKHNIDNECLFLKSDAYFEENHLEPRLKQFAC